MSRAPRRALAVAALCILWVVAAQAHQINTSYTNLAVAEAQLNLAVSIDEGDLLLLFPEIDSNGDGMLWVTEVLAGADAAQAWVAGRVILRCDGERLAATPLAPEVETDSDGNLFARLRFEVDKPPGLQRLELDLRRFLQSPLSPEHRNLFRVVIPGEEEGLAVLSQALPVHALQIGGEPVGVLARVWQFTVLGVEHIFLGYDHIMFLLALIIVGSRLLPLVKIVSAFTVAHSITLILAALEWVSLPSQVVEAGIALSIAYVAAENFWLKRTDYRWILTFCFGFIHGFGFANVLRDLGLPSEGLIACLLAFNVGVEVGQVVIVAAVFPLILWAARHRYHQRMVQLVSAIILLFGLGWLVERVFGLSYMPI